MPEVDPQRWSVCLDRPDVGRCVSHTAFATVVTSDCSYRDLRPTQMSATPQIVGVSLLAIAVCQPTFMSKTRRFRDRRNLRLLLQGICVRSRCWAQRKIVGASLLANALCQSPLRHTLRQRLAHPYRCAPRNPDVSSQSHDHIATASGGAVSQRHWHKELACPPNPSFFMVV